MRSVEAPRLMSARRGWTCARTTESKLFPIGSSLSRCINGHEFLCKVLAIRIQRALRSVSALREEVSHRRGTNWTSQSARRIPTGRHVARYTATRGGMLFVHVAGNIVECTEKRGCGLNRTQENRMRCVSCICSRRTSL